MTFPSIRTSGHPSVPFWLKFFCLLISQLVFIGLLLYFTYSFLKTLAIHSHGIIVKNNYCKFKRLRLRFFFYKIWVFWSFWLNFFKVLLTWKCVAGLLLNFIKPFFITFAIVSQPFSVKIVICNSQFTHFLTGVDFEFFTTIFRLLFSGWSVWFNSFW